MNAPDRPRFVVEKHGPGAYYVFNTATCLSRYPCFTRRGAQKIADRKNAEHAARERRSSTTSPGATNGSA